MRARAAAAVAVAGVVAAALGGAAGCDWRKFDSLQSETPVLNVSAPSGFGTPQSFGRVLLPLSPPGDGSAAARFMTSSVEQTALAFVSLDVAGHASATNMSGGGLDQIGGDPVLAMAEVPGTGQALLGAPNQFGGGGDLLLADIARPNTVTMFATNSTEPQFGVGVAAGQLGGGAAPDLVAVSGNALHVFVDGTKTAQDLYRMDIGPTDPCPLALSSSLPARVRTNRAVVIADLLGTGTPQIAVGTPVPSGGGAVSILTVDTTTGTTGCALTLRGSTGLDQLFGEALAAGDFDGDGVTDLLVGDPPHTVYFYRGPITTTPTATITNAAGLDFGAALAAIDLDGKAGDEMLIADPDATVGGQDTAGTVAIYKLTSPTTATQVMPTPAISVLADHSPSAGEAFGTAVGALPFCAPAVARPDAGADAGPAPAGDAGAACVITALPIVGSTAHGFTYFTLGPVDPRRK
jgi:hypothetical protein